MKKNGNVSANVPKICKRFKSGGSIGKVRYKVLSPTPQ